MNHTLAQIKPVKTIEGATPDSIPADVFLSDVPVILKGLVTDWPMVQAAKHSKQAAMDYLLQFDSGMDIATGEIDSKYQGRLFYNDDFSGFNFTGKRNKLSTFFTQLANAEPTIEKTGYYLGSTHINKLLPGFNEHNDIAALNEQSPLASIWISNQTQVAAHHDVPSNIACCVAGKRRFTLFPPEQVENLYIGPLDFTPAGQAISLVDLHHPDLDKFPKFEQALASAQVAELDAGDALFIPSMWWHHVAGLTDFNVLVNYSWQQNNVHMGAPMDAMFHALLNIKDLPKSQKQAWRAMFEHYVFNDDINANAHIPKDKLGVLDCATDNNARRLRSLLINKLNR